jgi:hypothetical protein
MADFVTHQVVATAMRGCHLASHASVPIGHAKVLIATHLLPIARLVPLVGPRAQFVPQSQPLAVSRLREAFCLEPGAGSTL